ncbi:MAG: hypothetical protein EPN60_07325 [Nevskiaceae bacterium]|nr:MAG: hypothetical protein EPO48_08865 [Nevskiaceae bacterium]TAM28355.1 MAG: hypothetical protein EPN60_07325 [Nevskiaceae bacterium]
MNHNIYTAQGFSNALHPPESEGKIVLVRQIGERKDATPVDSRELTWACSQAAGQSGFYFSLCSFFGTPLLLNVASVRGLVVSCPFDSRPGSNTLDLADEAELLLRNNDLPLPSAVVYDGQRAHFLWLLDEPIRGHEVDRLFVMGDALASILKPTGLTIQTKDDIANLVPLVESRNSATEKIVRVDSSSWRGPVSRRLFERQLLVKASALDLDMSSTAWHTLRELERLFHHRWALFAQPEESVRAWLACFGAALSSFCKPTALKRELRAVAESLLGQSWRVLSTHWAQEVEGVAAQIARGSITLDGSSYSVSRTSWRDAIAPSLKITAEEMSAISLYELRPEDTRAQSRRIIEPWRRPSSPFGFTSTIPLQRLFLRSALTNASAARQHSI